MGLLAKKLSDLNNCNAEEIPRAKQSQKQNQNKTKNNLFSDLVLCQKAEEGWTSILPQAFP